MRNIKIIPVAFLLFIFCTFSCAENEPTINNDTSNEIPIDNGLLRSPDGKISVKLELNENKKVFYKVFITKDGQEVTLLQSSPLGIVRNDICFDALEYISHSQLKTADEVYTLSSGKRLFNRNYFNELTFHFKNLDIVFRAYNDGIAFRYVFPGETNNGKTYKVLDELTGFKFPQGKAWMQPYDEPSAYGPAYERYYEGYMPIGTSSPTKVGWCFPALFEVSNHWVLLSESDLKSNFYGSHLEYDSYKGLYKVVPPLENEAFGYGHSYAESTLPWEMPWRVILIGDELSDIVESNLINHLATPSKIYNTSWIKPGRASWAWWSGYLDGTTDTPEKLMKYIDFAHEMSWEYSLIDAGWDYRGINIKELANYAAKKNVKLLLWYNSGGPINQVDAGPRDRMFDPKIRKEEMKRIADLGIKGIKVDFFGSDKQDFIKLYHDILEDAAEFKLLVNFHGCTIPRGWLRTYPNLISMEAVLGEEGYIYRTDYPEKAPKHCTILPFTRNVIGPMDYTPVAFSFQQFPHKTSFGFELALSIVFESGIQHFPDKPEIYLSQPKEVVKFLKDVPVAWDETKLLSGFPGSDVLIAREKEGDWYVGCINGEPIEKEIEVNFNFLEPNSEYKAVIIKDGDDSKKFFIENKTVIKGHLASIKVLPHGGFVIQLNRNPS